MILVEFNHKRPKDPPISLAMGSIIAKLKSEGLAYETHNVDVSSGKEVCMEGILASALSPSWPPCDLVTGAFVWNDVYVQRLIAALCERGFKGRIGVAGAQVSYADKGTLETYYPQAHFYIRGFAEDAVAHIARGGDGKGANVEGLHWNGTPDLGLQANPDFEQLPSPYLEGVIKPTPFMRWETQRGCPFNCSFCQHKSARGGVNYFHTDRVMKEIDLICNDPIGKKAEIAIVDPTFNSSKRCIEILDAFYQKGFQGTLECQIRPEKITHEFCEAVERMKNHVVLEMGVQTMVPEEIKLIERMKTQVNNSVKVCEKVNEKLGLVRDRGFRAELSLIFGLPNQTVDSFRRSIMECRKAIPYAKIHCFPLMLLRGTGLYKDKKKLGLVEDFIDHPIRDRLQDHIPHVVQTPTMSKSDWKTMASIACGNVDA